MTPQPRCVNCGLGVIHYMGVWVHSRSPLHVKAASVVAGVRYDHRIEVSIESKPRKEVTALDWPAEANYPPHYSGDKD